MSEIDPVVSAIVRQLRDAILDIDVTLVQAANRRIHLAARLAAYRNTHGMPAVEGADDEWILGYLKGANAGPLTDDGLERLYAAVRSLDPSSSNATH